jgi:tellurite resistance protein TehA-like permease
VPRRKKKADAPPQVGRRPSSPAYLAVVGVMWVAVGVIDIVRLKAGWRIAVGIVFIGIGLFFLRGAAMTVVRRDERRAR